MPSAAELHIAFNGVTSLRDVGGGTAGGSPAALGSRGLHGHGVEQGEVAGAADGQRPRRVVPHGLGHRGEGGSGATQHEMLLPRPRQLHVHEAVAAPVGGEGKLRHAVRRLATFARCLSAWIAGEHASTRRRMDASAMRTAQPHHPVTPPPMPGLSPRQPRVPSPAPRSPERQRVVVGAGLAVPHQEAALAAQRQQRLGARPPDGAVVPPAWWWVSPRHPGPRTHLRHRAPCVPWGAVPTTWTHQQPRAPAAAQGAIHPAGTCLCHGASSTSRRPTVWGTHPFQRDQPRREHPPPHKDPFHHGYPPMTLGTLHPMGNHPCHWAPKHVKGTCHAMGHSLLHGNPSMPCGTQPHQRD